MQEIVDMEREIAQATQVITDKYNAIAAERKGNYENIY
jgi:hypothetical protein